MYENIKANILWLALLIVMCTIGIAAVQYVLDCADMARLGMTR